ncbi:MAG: mechanosensitive ion channel [Chitinivibrionales bacterium]|nr:mechanosensitive ion channel [Chitinivibrionales bacterium]
MAIPLSHDQLTLIAAAIGVILAFVLGYLTHRAEKRQRERLKGLPGQAPIRTESPVDQPLKKAKQKALHSIRTRFSIIRQLIAGLFVLLVLLALSLGVLGAIPAALLSTIVAAVSVIIGIAARPLLENFVAGIMMTFSGIIRIGDTVDIQGSYGTIEDVTLTHTVVKVWNWRRHVIPNAVVMTCDFLNLTLYDTYQWCHAEFWVSPDADLDVVEHEAIEAARVSSYFAGHESPRFWVMETGKDGVRCWVAAWANSPSDAWNLTNDMRTGVATRLQRLGIPPHRRYVAVQGHGPDHMVAAAEDE